MFGIWELGLGNSFWDRVIQISFRRIFKIVILSEKNINLFLQHLLLKFKLLFSRNSYTECLTWIFLFDTDQAQNYNAGEFSFIWNDRLEQSFPVEQSSFGSRHFE
jgi:hypothetical protein